MQKSQLNILSEEGFRAVEEGYLRGGGLFPTFSMHMYTFVRHYITTKAQKDIRRRLRQTAEAT